MRPPIPEQPYTYLFRGALGGVAVGSPVLLKWPYIPVFCSS